MSAVYPSMTAVLDQLHGAADAPLGVAEVSPDDVLMTEGEVCALGRCCTKTLRKWVAAGKFPAPLDWPGRDRLWRRADVLAWVQSLPARLRRQTNAGEPAGRAVQQVVVQADRA